MTWGSSPVPCPRPSWGLASALGWRWGAGGVDPCQVVMLNSACKWLLASSLCLLSALGGSSSLWKSRKTMPGADNLDHLYRFKRDRCGGAPPPPPRGSVGQQPDRTGSGHCRGVGSIAGLVQWVKGSCIVAAAPPFQSLAQKLFYAAGVVPPPPKKRRCNCQGSRLSSSAERRLSALHFLSGCWS